MRPKALYPPPMLVRATWLRLSPLHWVCQQKRARRQQLLHGGCAEGCIRVELLAALPRRRWKCWLDFLPCEGAKCDFLPGQIGGTALILDLVLCFARVHMFVKVVYASRRCAP